MTWKYKGVFKLVSDREDRLLVKNYSELSVGIFRNELTGELKFFQEAAINHLGVDNIEGRLNKPHPQSKEPQK